MSSYRYTQNGIVRVSESKPTELHNPEVPVVARIMDVIVYCAAAIGLILIVMYIMGGV